jgi:hypothetical protein
MCQTNHCVKDFINQHQINNSQILNGCCFVTNGVFEAKELYHETTMLITK